MTKEEFAMEFEKLIKKKHTQLLLTKRDMLEQAISERLENPITLKNINIVECQLAIVEIDQLIFINNQDDFEELKKAMERDGLPKKTNPDIN